MNHSPSIQLAAVLRMAAREAAHLGHPYVGTEHQLLALLGCGDPEVVQLLAAAGADADDVRTMLLNSIRQGEHGGVPAGVELPYTSRAKRVVELAFEEAEAAGGGPPTPRHLLAGLVREGHNVAAQVLRRYRFPLS
jgi:ATP-dependent Clp protease ATP-binding subunit ClpC